MKRNCKRKSARITLVAQTHMAPTLPENVISTPLKTFDRLLPGHDGQFVCHNCTVIVWKLISTGR